MKFYHVSDLRLFDTRIRMEKTEIEEVGGKSPTF